MACPLGPSGTKRLEANVPMAGTNWDRDLGHWISWLAHMDLGLGLGTWDKTLGTNWDRASGPAGLSTSWDKTWDMTWDQTGQDMGQFWASDLSPWTKWGHTFVSQCPNAWDKLGQGLGTVDQLACPLGPSGPKRSEVHVPIPGTWDLGQDIGDKLGQGQWTM